MKYITIILVLLLCSACAKITVVKEGEDWDVSYSVLWRESEDVLIEKDGIRVEFGRAGSDDPIEEIMLSNGWQLRYDNPDLNDGRQ
jgi:hypothetical protein